MVDTGIIFKILNGIACVSILLGGVGQIIFAFKKDLGTEFLLFLTFLLRGIVVFLLGGAGFWVIIGQNLAGGLKKNMSYLDSQMGTGLFFLFFGVGNLGGDFGWAGWITLVLGIIYSIAAALGQDFGAAISGGGGGGGGGGKTSVMPK